MTVQAETGRLSVVTTEAGSKVQTKFMIVSGDDLIVSNNPDGTINPAYPADLQPRNRTTIHSRLQVNRIAQSINPSNLGNSDSANAGAPIVGPDYVVESGNGRTMGILRAYASGRANHYRRYLADHAEIFGLAHSDVMRMNDPILVRLRTSNVNRAQFARDANFKAGQAITEGVTDDLAMAALDTNWQPTEAQKLAGNYSKGHLIFQGLPLTIENPKGSVRSGMDEDGNRWESLMHHHYGYINKTTGADSDHLDVFIGPAVDSGHVFIVNQSNPSTREFDEHKIMLAFNSQEEAQAAYLSNYEDGWTGLDSIHQLPISDFKSWIEHGDLTHEYQPEQAMVESAQQMAITSTPQNETAQKALSGCNNLTDIINRIESLGEIQGSVSLQDAVDHGRISYVVTVKGDEVKTGFKLVEASDLITSNTLDGKVNGAYPQELQPRDRTRAASIMQITKLSKSLRPVQLADSGLSSHGAPIVGSDRVVESGNGRSMAIIKAYSDGNADKYRQYLDDNAELYGFKKSDVQGMKQPVLVRVRLDDVDRLQFTKDSNISDLQAMSPVEQARVDAENLDEKTMALFSPSESGDLLSASNMPFIQAFMAHLGSEQAAGYMTADGRPTKQIIDRIQGAIFAKAYQNEKLLRLSVEEPDPEIRNVLTALNSAAPDFISMKYLSGEAHKQTTDTIAGGADLVDSLDEQALSALVDATTLVRSAKTSGQNIEEYLSQQGLFGDNDPAAEALARFIANNNRSAKRMGEAFKALAAEINAELAHQGQAAGDMFGAEPLDLITVLARVSDQMTENYGDKAGLTMSMFESADALLEAVKISKAKLTKATAILDGCNSLQELTERISGLGLSPSSQEDMESAQAAIKTAVLRLATTTPEDSSALTGYRAYMKALLSGATYSEISKRDWLRKALLEGLYSAGVPIVTISQKEFRTYVTDGSMFQLIPWCFQFEQEEDHKLKVKIAKKTLRAGYDLVSKKSGQQRVVNRDFVAAANHLSGGIIRTRTIIDMFNLAGEKDGSELTPEQARNKLESHKKNGADFLESLNIRAAKDEAQRRINQFNDQLKRALNGEVREGVGADFDNAITQIATDRSYRKKLETLAECLDKGQFGSGCSAREGGYGQIEYLDSILTRSDQLSYLLRPEDQKAAADKKSAITAIKKEYLKATEPVTLIMSTLKDKLLESAPISDEQTQTLRSQVSIDKKVINSCADRFDLEQLVESFIKMTGVLPETLKNFTYQGDRAHANAVAGRIQLGAGSTAATVWHEMGHHIEYTNPDLLAVVKQYLLDRNKGSENNMLSLRAQFGGNYKASEVAINDSLSHPYIGKVYSNSSRVSDAGSSEVISSGFELLMNPEKAAESHLNGDGLIEFIMGIIKELQSNA
jgi:hypothetical protein